MILIKANVEKIFCDHPFLIKNLRYQTEISSVTRFFLYKKLSFLGVRPRFWRKTKKLSKKLEASNSIQGRNLGYFLTTPIILTTLTNKFIFLCVCQKNKEIY